MKVTCSLLHGSSVQTGASKNVDVDLWPVSWKFREWVCANLPMPFCVCSLALQICEHWQMLHEIGPSATLGTLAFFHLDIKLSETFWRFTVSVRPSDKVISQCGIKMATIILNSHSAFSGEGGSLDAGSRKNTLIYHLQSRHQCTTTLQLHTRDIIPTAQGTAVKPCSMNPYPLTWGTTLDTMVICTVGWQQVLLLVECTDTTEVCQGPLSPAWDTFMNLQTFSTLLAEHLETPANREFFFNVCQKNFRTVLWKTFLFQDNPHNNM